MLFKNNIYIFAKNIYMEARPNNHRKLIDLSEAVFETRSMDAEQKKVSLKRYIENLLQERAKALDDAVNSLDISPSVLRLVGSALPAKGKVEDIEDDRLKYLLSK